MASSIVKALKESGSAVLLLAVAASFWTIEVVDRFVLGNRLEGGGIHPRRVDGIDGIAWAPFLHSGFPHLISNTIPFLVLGGLVAVGGRKHLLNVSGQVILLGGAAVWIFGKGGNHVGASGLIFGYFGALIGGAIFRRQLSSILTAAVAVVLYGTMIFGFLPRAGISWEGHLFGFLAGVFAAKMAGVTNSNPKETI